MWRAGGSSQGTVPAEARFPAARAPGWLPQRRPGYEGEVGEHEEAEAELVAEARVGLGAAGFEHSEPDPELVAERDVLAPGADQRDERDREIQPAQRSPRIRHGALRPRRGQPGLFAGVPGAAGAPPLAKAASICF